MPIDEDSPVELLWAELRESELWSKIEKALLEKRDRMLALVIMDEDCKPKRGTDGSVESEDAGVILARIQRRFGYMEAINAIVAAPKVEHDKAIKARETKK